MMQTSKLHRESEVMGVNLANWDSVSSSLRLPREISEISAEFLTQALQQRFPEVSVRDFKIPFIHHGFTTILRLELELDDLAKASGVPSTIIMKGGFEPETRRIGDYAIGPFLMEVGAYRNLPGLGLNMPDCYFAEVDMGSHGEAPQIILLMEDLTLRGARFNHGLVPHGVAQVRNRLTAVAALHARTWGSPELEQGGRYAIFPHNANVLFKGYLEHVAPPQQWRQFCEMPRGAACAVEFHDLDWMLRAMDFMIELGDATPNCLVHGDLHSGNLFEDADGRAGFYDSLPMRTAPMIEVSYHITNVLDHGDRQRHDRELVDHYRKELIRNGVDAPGLDELMYQFAAFLPYGYATFLINASTYQTESFNTAHTGRYNVAMLQHGTRDIIA
jgi:hypothetical protein